MKIVFSYPQFGCFKKEGLDAPLGLMYLASVLRDYGHEVKIVDNVFQKSWEYLRSEIVGFKPQLVGIYCACTTADVSLEAARICKTISSKTMIVMGGPHATLCPEVYLNNANVDFVLRGEGERAILELVRCMEGNEDYTKIMGLCYKDEESLVISQTFAMEPDIDKLSFPAWDLVDYNNYIDVTHNATILVSRGCSYNCLFCQPAIKEIFGSALRIRNVDNVISEIQELKKRFKQKFLLLMIAEVFTENRQWIIHLCDKIEEINIKIPWWCSTRADKVDEYLLRKMKAAGCIGVSFGVESGSQRILDYLKKDIIVDDIKRAFVLCDKIGLLTIGFFMIGTPTESYEDIKKTADLIGEIKPDIITLSITTPLPGTDLFQMSKKEGLFNILNFQDYSMYDNKYPLILENLSSDDIQRGMILFRSTWKKNWFKTGRKYFRLLLTSNVGRGLLLTQLIKLMKRKLLPQKQMR